MLRHVMPHHKESGALAISMLFLSSRDTVFVIGDIFGSVLEFGDVFGSARFESCL
jgi:hypothetical protein